MWKQQVSFSRPQKGRDQWQARGRDEISVQAMRAYLDGADTCEARKVTHQTRLRLAAFAQAVQRRRQHSQIQVGRSTKEKHSYRGILMRFCPWPLLLVLLAGCHRAGTDGPKVDPAAAEFGVIDTEEKAIAILNKYHARVRRNENQPNKPVIEVHLNGDRWTDATLQALVPLKDLQRLYLQATPVTDAGLKKIIGLQNLESLEIYACRGVTNAGIKDIARLSRLKILGVEITGVTGGTKGFGSVTRVTVSACERPIHHRRRLGASCCLAEIGTHRHWHHADHRCWP